MQFEAFFYSFDAGITADFILVKADDFMQAFFGDSFEEFFCEHGIHRDSFLRKHSPEGFFWGKVGVITGKNCRQQA